MTAVGDAEVTAGDTRAGWQGGAEHAPPRKARAEVIRRIHGDDRGDVGSSRTRRQRLGARAHDGNAVLETPAGDARPDSLAHGGVGFDADYPPHAEVVNPKAQRIPEAAGIVHHHIAGAQGRRGANVRGQGTCRAAVVAGLLSIAKVRPHRIGRPCVEQGGIDRWTWVRARHDATNFAISPSGSHPVRRLIVIASVLLVAACGGKSEEPAPTRTKEQQRAVDSTVGASALPGARGVQGAMKAADSAAARNRELDSLSKLP